MQEFLKVFRFFILTITCMVCGFSAFSQKAGDYRSVSSGNWNNLSTWQIFNGTTWVSPTAIQGNPNSSSGAIIIQADNKVTITDSVVADQISIQAKGELVLDSGGILNVQNGTGHDLLIYGTFTNSGSFTSSGTIVINGNSFYNHNVQGVFPSMVYWHPTALIEFSGGGTSEMRISPATLSCKLSVKNNTNLLLSGLIDSAVFTLGNGTNTDLIVESGSKLTLSPTLKSFGFSANANAEINGILINHTQIDLSADEINLTVNGKLENKGSFTGTNASKLIFSDYSTYEHTSDGGIVPSASFAQKSSCLFTGLKNIYPAGLNQVFGHVTFRSPLAADINMLGSLDCTGNLTIANTTNYALILNTDTLAHTILVGGNFNLDAGSLMLVDSSGTGSLQVAGSINQSTGSLILKSAGGDALIYVSGDFYKENGDLLFSDSDSAAINGDARVIVKNNFVHLAGLVNFASLGGSGYLFVGGDFSHAGGTFTETGTGNGNIFFSGTDSQEFQSGGIVQNEINFTVDSLAFLQMADAETRIAGIGTFTLQPGSTIGIRHMYGINLAPSSNGHITTAKRIFHSGANYVYNGNASQITGNAMAEGTAASITFDNPAIVTQTTALHVTGDLNIKQGEYYTRNLHLVLEGNWINDGKYNPGNLSQVNFAGYKMQLISGTAVTRFLNLIINNESGVRLEKETTIISLLTLTNGNLFVENQVLNFCNTALPVAGAPFSRTKMILLGEQGEVRREAKNYGQANFSFPIGNRKENNSFYSPISFYFSGGAINGFYGVKVSGNPHPHNPDPNNYISRYWTVEQEGFTGFKVAVTAMFDSADVVGDANAIRLAKYNVTTDSIPWTSYPTPPDGNILYASGITSFSDFSGFGSNPLLGTTYFSKKRTINTSTATSTINTEGQRQLLSGPPSIKIFPNPVTGKRVSLLMNNFGEGKYEMIVTNGIGQKVLSKTIETNGGTNTQTLQLQGQPKGVYRLQVNGTKENFITSFILD